MFVQFGARGSLKNLKQELLDVQKAVMAVNTAMASGPKGARRGIADTFIKDLDKFENAYKKHITSIQSIKGRSIDSPVTQLTKSLEHGELKLNQFGSAMRNFNGLVERQQRLMQSAFVTTGIDEFGNKTGRLLVPLEAVRNRAQKAWIQIRMMGTIANLASKEMIKLGKNMQWAGRQVLVGFGIPLFFLAQRAMATFLSLDKEFTRLVKVYSVQGGHAAKELRLVKDEIDALGNSAVREFGVSKKAAIETAANFAAMGNTIEASGGQLETMTNQTLRIATLGEMSTQGATELVRTVQQVWQMTNQELVQTLDTFNSIENRTALSMDMMKDAIPVVAGTVKELGLSAEFTAAMLAGMVEKGEDATEAATALKFGLTRMVVGTEPMQKWADATGTSLQKIRDESDGTAELLHNITKVLADLPDPEKRLEAVAALVQPRRAGQFIKLFDSINESLNGVDNGLSRAASAIGDFEGNAKDAKEELDAWRNSAAGIAQVLKERFSIVLAEIGETMSKTLLPAAEKVLEILEKFTAMPEEHKRMILGFLSLGAAMGGLTMFLGLAFNLMGQFASVFTKVIPKIKDFSFYQHATRLATDSVNTALRTEIALADTLGAKLASMPILRGFSATGNAVAGSMAMQEAMEVFHAGGSSIDKKNAIAAGLDKQGIREQRLTDGITARRIKGKEGVRFFDADGVRLPQGAALPDLERDYFGDGLDGDRARRRNRPRGYLHKRRRGLGRLLPFIAPTNLMRRGLAAGGEALNARSMASAIQSPSIVGTAMSNMGKKGVFASMGSGISKMLPKTGALRTGFDQIAKSVGFITSKLGGLSGILSKLGIAGLIAGIAAAVMDFKSFMSGFKESFDFSAFKKLWESIKSIGRIFSSLKNDSGETGKAISRISKLLGKIVGFVANQLVSAFQVIVDIVRFIASGLGDIIVGVIRFFDELFHGDGPILTRIWNAFFELFRGLLKGIAKLAAGIILPIVRWLVDHLATLLEKIPGPFGEEMARNLRKAADGFEERMELILDIEPEVKSDVVKTQVKDVADNTKKVIEQAGEKAKEIWEATGIAGRKMTAEAIKNNEKMTAEEKKFLRNWMRLKELKLQLLELYQRREELLAMKASIMTSKWIDANMSQIKQKMRQVELTTNHVTNAMNGANDAASMFSGNLDDVTEATEEANEAASEYVSSLQAASSEMINTLAGAAKEAWGEHRDAVLEAIDAEIDALEEQESEEEEVNKNREKRARLEELRRKRLLNLITKNIEIEAALADGQLDQAAILQEQLKADEEAAYFERLKVLQEADKKKKEEEESAAVKAKKEKKKQLEEQLEMDEKNFDYQLELLLRHVPKTEAEFKKWHAKLLALSERFGVDLSAITAQLPSDMTVSWSTVMFDTMDKIAEDNRWKTFGEEVGASMAEGMVKAVEEEIRKQTEVTNANLTGEQMREKEGGTPSNNSTPTHHFGSADAEERRHRDKFHTGGFVGGGAKADIPAILQQGEFVIKRDTVKAFGPDFFKQVNAGKLPYPLNEYHTGGMVEARGLGSVFNTKSVDEAMHEMITGLVSGSRKFRTQPSTRPANPGSGGGGSTPVPSGSAGSNLISPDHDMTKSSSKYYGGWKTNLRMNVIQDAVRGLHAIGGPQGIINGYRDAAHNRAVGGAPGSDHMTGKAVDIWDTSTGNSKSGLIRIAQLFRKMPGVRWVGAPDNDPNGHDDHTHVSWFHKGGLVPSLAKGAFIKKDTLANVHKGEAVLTSPLTAELRDGIKKMNANGSGGDVHVHVTVKELYGDREFVDILANRVTGTVTNEIKKNNARKGRGLGL